MRRLENADKRILVAIAYGTAAVLCILFSFRYFIFSGFESLAGDDGDARLIMAQLEHWRSVFGRKVWYDSPIWFHPIKHVLGIQDALFLNGLTYVAARLLLDEHAALEVGAMLTNLVGFAGMALLLRQGLGLGIWMALFGAVLLLVQGGLYWMHIGPHIAVVFFLPLLGFLVVAGMTRPQTKPTGWMLPAAAALFVGVWWSTFYFAWYTALLFIVVTLISVPIALYRVGFRSALDCSIAFARERCFEIGAAGIVVIVGGIAFISLYLPHLRRHGGWPYQMIDERLMRVTDFVAFERYNWVWSAFSNQSDSDYGFPPLFAALCLAGVLWSTWRVLQRSGPLSILDFYGCAVGLAGLSLWLCFVKIGNWTAYEYFYRYVPGATAMRVPVRINFFLAVVFVPIVVTVIHRAWNASRRSLLLKAMTIAIMCLALAEQGTSREISSWSRSRDRALLDSIPPPPAFCRSFFVNWPLPRPWDGPLLQFFYAPTSDAMLIAARYRLPTLNGLGTAADDGWPAPPPMYERYEQQVIPLWVHQHKLQRVCRLVLPIGKWEFYPGSWPG